MPGLSDKVKQQMVAELAAAPHGQRTAKVKQLAAMYQVSQATIYRLAQRGGTRKTRTPQKPEYRQWTRTAVALAKCAPKRLPLDLALRAGIASGRLPPEAKAMPLGTAYRLAREMGLTEQPKRTHRMSADYPMQAVQFDGSTSEYLVVDKALPDGDYLLTLHRQPTPASGYKNKPLGADRLRVQVYAIWDMCTGYQLAVYKVAKGENALDSMAALCGFLAEKDDQRIPFHGVPDDLWADQGPLFKSGPATDLLERLDIHLVTGAPYAKERLGGVERTHRTRWNRFEQSLFVRGAETITLSQLNAHLTEYLIEENAKRPSRTEVAGKPAKRTAAWVALTNGRPKENPLRKLPADPIATMAREARRFVDVNGILRWAGQEYELPRLHSCWVIARRAMDNTDHVVVEDERGGKHLAMPWRPRPYGEVMGSPNSERETRQDTIDSSSAGVDLYAPDSPHFPGAQTDGPGRLLSLRPRSGEAAPLTNPLDAEHYASMEEAMRAFSALYTQPLTAANHVLVRQHIEASGLNKHTVRELAQELSGLGETHEA